jgi:polyphosphate kinase 2 (PPK2 family)
MARDRQRHLKLRCAPPVRNTFAERQRNMSRKIWLEAGIEEHEKRFAARIDDPPRQWS